MSNIYQSVSPQYLAVTTRTTTSVQYCALPPRVPVLIQLFLADADEARLGPAALPAVQTDVFLLDGPHQSVPQDVPQDVNIY